MTSSYGNNYHYGDRVESGQFAFVAVEAGDYMTCFWAVDHNPQITLTIDFEWKTGVAAKDWSNVAKKGQVDVSHTLLYPSLIPLYMIYPSVSLVLVLQCCFLVIIA